MKRNQKCSKHFWFHVRLDKNQILMFNRSLFSFRNNANCLRPTTQMYKIYTKKRGMPNRHIAKLCLVIRLSIILLISSSMQVAGAGFAQTISLTKKNVPLKQVFWDIKSQSGYNFLYTENLLKIANPVSIDVKGMPLESVLAQIFDKQPLSYQIESKTVIIKLKPRGTPIISHEIGSDLIDIKGTVKNETGMPLSGATIKLKVGNKGTTSNQQGQFSLSNVDKDATLLISYTGYIAQEIMANGQATFNIVLKEDLGKLSEVVVVGYGVQKRANLTGAVSTITSKDIENRVVSNAANALQGADPSLNITFGTGVLDGEYGINVRGVPSLNGGSPLIIADGVEVNLNQINPHDIESVTVLKDASAAAIYGAKASSGVIQITTKRGKDMSGKSEVTYEGRTGFSQNTTSTDFIRTGYDHVNVVNKFYNIYQGTDMLLYNEEDMQLLQDRRNDLNENPDRPWTIVKDDNKYYYYGNTDWYGYFYKRTRPQQEHNASIRGGNDKIRYYTSGRFWSQDGIFNIYEDKYKNYSFFAKIDATLKPWLKYTGNASYNSSTYNYAGFNDEQMTIHNLQSNTISSFVPFNPDGTIVQYTNQLNANSPLGAGHVGFLSADQARNSRGNNYIVLSNRFDFEVTKDFTVTAMYAYKKRDRLYKYRNMPFDYSREVGKTLGFTSGTIYDFYQENHYDLNNHNANIYGTFNKSINNTHNLNFVLGGQYEDYRDVNLMVKKADLLSKDLSSFAIANGEATITQNINAFRTLGFFARANYDYKGKYLFEASGRWDGTSRFSPTERWGFFPSASAGWRMSEENFWTPLKNIIQDSKVRLSYGSLGNQQVGNYAYIEEINASNTMDYTFDGTTKALYSSISNPITSNLTWETITTYNLGLDLSLIGGKMNFTGDYFIRDTKDMLTQTLTLPAVFGANTPEGNAADLRAKGWELTLSWKDRITLASKPFNYNVSVTLGDYITTITKYNNPDNLIGEQYIGRKFGEIWGYKVKGLFATDADAEAYQARIDDKAVNNRVYTSKKENYLRAGDVEFIDINNDGIINEGSGTLADPGDKVIIGNSQPRYNYSLRVGADWLGFDVSVFFQGIGKRNWFPTQTAYDFWGPYSFPSLSFVQEDFMSNVWSEENPNAYFPKPRGYASYSSGALGVANDRYIQDVSYLRLKNLTLGYTLPIKSKALSKVRVYASGENLFYWSNLKKYSKTVDPELTVTSSTYNSNSGVGYSFPKLYTFGLSVIF